MARDNRLIRYHSVAVSLHWLIAIGILGLIAVAKVSHSLATDDPLRFTLIQWHKSFGIAVLLLVLLRIAWRLTHKPPPLPSHMGTMERLAASLGHLGLYGLMLAMPLTGWALVSASPLNLATELFGVIPWPHIPWLENVADKEVWESRFGGAHYWLGNGLMALVLVHALAALRHHFWLRDGLLTRMTVAAGDQRSGLLFGLLIAAGGMIGLANLGDQPTPGDQPGPQARTAATDSAVVSTNVMFESQVGFAATQLGDPINGVFTVHEITLSLDDRQLDNASLNATVITESIATDDSQIDATLMTPEWLAPFVYPRASFASSSISKTADGAYEVSGTLTIRDQAREVIFPMQREGVVFSGELLIDRREFGIGVGGQDEFVGPDVIINFSFAQP